MTDTQKRSIASALWDISEDDIKTINTINTMIASINDIKDIKTNSGQYSTWSDYCISKRSRDIVCDTCIWCISF